MTAVHLAAAVATAVIALLAFASLYRAYVGPTTSDRVISINIITTKVTVLIVLLAVVTDQHMFVDVALIYAMMGFIATVSVAKYIDHGDLR